MCFINQNPSISYFDIVYKSATVIIAACNVLFALWIFWNKTKKDDSNKEKDRKILWFKVLLLDYNLKYFYTFFDKLETGLSNLKNHNLSQADKEAIESAAADDFIVLRRKFTDTLLAIDKSLYDRVLTYSDDLQSSISSAIFDGGINLSHNPKYDEVISEKLTEIKTNIINLLFCYRG